MRGEKLRGNRGGMLEQLESRRLLAGNVVASFDGTTFNIVGDSKSNQIDVEAGTGFAGYTITGRNGTTVNGAPSQFVSTSGSPPPILNIDLGNGDDDLELFPFADISNPGITVFISGGNGNDTLALFNWGCDSLTIDAGNGNDTVALFGLFANDLDVALGNGTDRCLMAGTIVLGQVGSIDGGNGKDVLDVSGLDLVNSSFSLSIPGFETIIEPLV